MPSDGKKVAIIGLDCATPRLLFQEYLDDLPFFKRLIGSGVYGRLRSTDPPITCPAWMSMATGRDPGKLGVYGFRNRVDHSYSKMELVTSASIRVEPLWDILGRHGKKSIVVGVPPSFPPKELTGLMVSCFLAPSAAPYTYPRELQSEIEMNSGSYVLDVNDFRTHDKERLLRDIYRMTESRFRTVRYLVRNKPWDFLMMVDMGLDRLHHGFWRYGDPEHRLFEPGNKFQNAMKDFHRYVDRELEALFEFFDQDTLVLVVSDHGAKRLDGCFALNQWLILNGYLEVEDYPVNDVVPMESVRVNWARTMAWADGGFYGRIFLNIKGREPQGCIDPGVYDTVRGQLREKLCSFAGPDGRPVGTRVLTPEELYGDFTGVAPDLFVYAGDLHWRCVGGIGYPDVFVAENDTGPDDANHDYHGVFIMHGKGEGKFAGDLHILDVAPTVLDYFHIDVPQGMTGKIISW